ncbi:ectonucleoside triphosphate diphosphohydrolase 2-like [Osmerus mordax]|uniref:ectonucleoside triphosphate diphosphohydrolase 2-like n=1 Tax=Osmerus mordax TaxID=8014 RepID=UPI00350EB067
MTNQYCHIIAPAVLLLLGLAGILLVVIPIYDVRESPENMYGVVLDAGSSHTTMFIYKWPADKVNGTGIVTQHSECHVKGGGISSYAGQRGGAARSLEACLEQALQDIPKSRHRLTPMYLGATAGMRLLNISNYTQSEQILKEVGNKLRTYPFNFRGAAILSGQEEGAYGWVTVNYLLENFIKYGFVGRWLSSGRKTVGALDFGGASTQITFETPDNMEDARNEVKLRLYGEDYHIYTHSFLCYGRDQVLRKLLAYLVKTQGSGGLISNPCHPAGHNISITLGSVFDSPCTAEHRPTPYHPQSSLTVQGTGNYQQCLNNVSEMFSFNKCSFSKCSFDGIFQPNVTGSFMAFSAFYYTHSFLERCTGIQIKSPSLLEGAARTVCNMSFQELSEKVPEEKKRLQDYCTVSVFIQVLTLEAYRFDEVSFPRISFQKKAGDTSIGWALGYMLSLSSLLPGESIGLRKALLPGAWLGLIFIFVFLLLIVFGYLVVMFCQRKKGGASVI